MESLQADKAMLEEFHLANCIVRVDEGKIFIDGSNRTSFQFDATNCPDLFPALVTLASLTPGISCIRGVNRLKNKESDRGKVLQSEFEKLGIQIEIHADEMQIFGVSKIKGGKVDSNNDHRIAMCLAVIGMFASGPVTIAGAEAVEKSYPRFWEEMGVLSCK